jgi:hypothetical protein
MGKFTSSPFRERIEVRVVRAINLSPKGSPHRNVWATRARIGMRAIKIPTQICVGMTY